MLIIKEDRVNKNNLQPFVVFRKKRNCAYFFIIDIQIICVCKFYRTPTGALVAILKKLIFAFLNQLNGCPGRKRIMTIATSN